MYTLPLFHSWTSTWGKDPKTSNLAEQANELARLRNNLKVPIIRSFEWKKSEITARIKLAHLLNITVNGADTSAAEIARCILLLKTPLNASFWPRWLELEDALAQCSTYGDLLLGAMVLRTQLEELSLRKNVLTTIRLAESVVRGDTKPEIYKELLELGGLLDSQVLYRLQPLTREEILRHPQNHRIASALGELLSLYDALGDYVHPNYGSHMLALRPNASIAGATVLKAFVALYNEFFEIKPTAFGAPASRQKPDFHKSQIGVDLLTETVPLLFNRNDSDEPLIIQIEKALDEFKTFIAVADETGLLISSESGVDDESLLVEQLLPVISEIQGINAPVSIESIFHQTDDQLPLQFRTPSCRLFWFLIAKSAISLDRNLNRISSTLGPGDSDESIQAWFDVIVDSLSLALNLTELKIMTLGDQSARFISRKNVLGATLAARSILEHHCVLVELGNKVEKHWHEAQAKKETGKLLELLESRLGLFLTGTKVTAEHATPWFSRWNNQSKCINVNDAVRQSGYEEGYAKLSKIVHANIYRGCDLLGEGGVAIQGDALRNLALALSDLLSKSKALDRSAKATIVAHEASLTDVRNSDNFAELQRKLQAQRLPVKYTAGKHLRGTGSEIQPFRFSKAFPYMRALIDYCNKNGLESDSLQIWSNGSSIGHAVMSKSGTLIHFLDSPF